MHEELRILPIRSAAQSITMRDIATVYFRHRMLFAISFCGVFLAGLLYALLAPSYKAEMKVLVRHGRIDPAVSPTETAPPLLDRDEISEEELNSEVELLQDEDVLHRVVVSAGLTDDAGWLSRLMRESQDEQIAHAVRHLAQKLDVQPVRKSHLITVTYKSTDPHRSAMVLKALADAYIARHVAIKRPSGQQSFFEQQMQQSKRALEEAEAQLVRFTRRRKVVSAALERDLTLQRMSDAQSADLELQASIAEAGERIRSLDGKLHEMPERKVSQIRNADNPQLQEKLKSKLLELELQRTELLTKFQPSYRLVQEVDKQIAQARAAIEAEDVRPLRDELTEDNPEYEWARSERMKAAVELQVMQKKGRVSQAQLASYKRTAERLGEEVLEQSDLQEKLKAAQDKFLLYTSKREEARIGDALDQSGILNVALAQDPRVPALPSWPLWAATSLSFAAALLLGSGTAFTADYFDPSVRTPDEVAELVGLPVLISLPAPASHPEQENS